MTPERAPSEFAHVLLIDIVAYSLQPIDEQLRLVAALQRVVRGTAEYRDADASGELIYLDRGDGMALVFRRDPVAPTRCALEIARGAAALPGLRLRMGLHSGPVSRAADLRGNLNVFGDGINTAQRVVDCGDEGHILLSRNVAGRLTSPAPSCRHAATRWQRSSTAPCSS